MTIIIGFSLFITWAFIFFNVFKLNTSIKNIPMNKHMQNSLRLTLLSFLFYFSTFLSVVFEVSSIELRLKYILFGGLLLVPFIVIAINLCELIKIHISHDKNIDLSSKTSLRKEKLDINASKDLTNKPLGNSSGNSQI